MRVHVLKAKMEKPPVFHYDSFKGGAPLSKVQRLANALGNKKLKKLKAIEDGLRRELKDDNTVLKEPEARQYFAHINAEVEKYYADPEHYVYTTMASAGEPTTQPSSTTTGGGGDASNDGPTGPTTAEELGNCRETLARLERSVAEKDLQHEVLVTGILQALSRQGVALPEGTSERLHQVADQVAAMVGEKERLEQALAHARARANSCQHLAEDGVSACAQHTAEQRDEIARLRLELQSATTNGETQVASLRGELERYTREAEANLSEARTERDAAARRGEEAGAAAERLQIALDEANGERVTAAGNAARATTAMEAQSAVVTQLRDELARAQESLTALQRTIDSGDASAASQIQQLQEELARTREDVRLRTEDAARLQSEMETRRVEQEAADTLRTTLVNQERENVARELRDAQDALALRGNRVAELEGTLDERTRALEKTTDNQTRLVIANTRLTNEALERAEELRMRMAELVAARRDQHEAEERASELLLRNEALAQHAADVERDRNSAIEMLERAQQQQQQSPSSPTSSNEELVNALARLQQQDADQLEALRDVERQELSYLRGLLILTQRLRMSRIVSDFERGELALRMEEGSPSLYDRWYEEPGLFAAQFRVVWAPDAERELQRYADASRRALGEARRRCELMNTTGSRGTGAPLALGELVQLQLYERAARGSTNGAGRLRLRFGNVLHLTANNLAPHLSVQAERASPPELVADLRPQAPNLDHELSLMPALDLVPARGTLSLERQTQGREVLESGFADAPYDLDALAGAGAVYGTAVQHEFPGGARLYATRVTPDLYALNVMVLPY